jgi:Family of unknown function (DUF6084)
MELSTPVRAPELAFAVTGAGPLERAAVPTLRFGLRIDAGGVEVRSILLHVQLQIAARRRRYDDAATARLFDLFGQPERWGSTLRTLPWARLTQVVPGFSDSTEVDLPLPCTYDFEVVAARYLDALREGEVPLELLFSGTVFYTGQQGRLQTAQIPWDLEAEYRLPVSVWRETMDLYYPGQTWLRLRRESFDRLEEYRASRGLNGLDEAVDSLLEGR